MNDMQRAAIIAFLQSLFPIAVLAGLEVSADAQAAIMLAITNGMTLFMLFWKKGQQPG